ncbi:MAG TPA: hypothetical protein VMZ05_01895 [Spirochaetota bacterium]|nr:hypothetical protein [Spirochaetota bacterium]
MSMINLLGELTSTYWNTFIVYLKSKRKDSRWVRSNLSWLERVMEVGTKALRSLNEEALYPFFEAVRENSELRRLLAAECRKVVLQYEHQSS